jgi:hypothetical protein
LPIWATRPKEIIEREHLVEVRVRTQDTISDSVITLLSMLPPIMIFPEHVIIEGNREADIVSECEDNADRAECASSL